MSEFIQCPHEVIEATCVGVCNCDCEGCAETRKHTLPRKPGPRPVIRIARRAQRRDQS